MRGKTEWPSLALTLRGVASMRPPQNAGENPRVHRVHSQHPAASMRPPQNAGENIITMGDALRLEQLQ